MVEAWLTCNYCNKRYSSSLSHCPKCNKPNPYRGLDIDLNSNDEIKPKKMISSKRILTIGIAVPVFLILLFAISGFMFGNSQSISYSNPYVNSAYGFSIRYPNGWIVQENYSEVIEGETLSSIVIFHNGKSQIDITARSMTMPSLTQEINKSKQESIDRFNKYNIVYTKEEFTKVNGQEAYLIHGVYTFDGIVYKAKAVILVHGNALHRIVYSSPEDQFSTDLTAFDKSVQSFKFLS